MSKLLLKNIFSCIFILSFVGYGYSQKATLKGRLTDAEKNESLPFANVIIGDGSGGATTDLDGNYEVMLDAGTYKVTYSFVGYADLIKNVTLTAGEIKVLDISLGTGAELLDQVVVTTNKSETKVGKSTVSVAVVQPSLIENTNSTAIDQVVEKVPGVTIIDGQANIRGGSGYSYGAGSRVLLMVDDMPFLAGDAGFPNWRDVPVENINQIEILKGAASALYGSSALNGIINVRTAYPTSDPYTKISAFGTYYGNPSVIDTCRYQGLGGCDTIATFRHDWWNQTQYIDGDTSTVAFDSLAVSPKYFGGQPGYNRPMETGIQFSHRQKFGKMDLVLGANYFHQDSYRRQEFDRKGRFNFNTRYRLTDNLSIGINGNMNIGKSSSFFLWVDPWQQGALPFADFTTNANTYRYNFDPYLTLFDKFENRHKIKTRYYYVNNDNGNNQSNKSHLYYGEYQFQRKFKQLDGLSVVAGLVGTFTTVDAELYGRATYSSSNIGSYLQLDKGFFKDAETDTDKLNLSVGMRYEVNTVNSPENVIFDQNTPTLLTPNNPKVVESKPVFRVGVNYEPREYTYLRASWGQGYRFPTIAERFITTNISLIGIYPNTDLESERGWSAEVGIKQGFKISTWQGFVDISGFWTEYQDMMEFLFAPFEIPVVNGTDTTMFNGSGFRSSNVGDTKIQGIDLSIIGQGKLFGLPTTLITGYTYINPTFKEWDAETPIIDGVTPTEGQLNALATTGNQNILKYRNKHSFKFDAETGVIPDKFNVGLSFTYNSFMQTVDDYFVNKVPLSFGSLDNIFGLREYREIYKKGNFLMDARISYFVTKKLKFSLVGKNLTNRSFTVRPALIDAPFNITFRADYKF